MPPSSIVKIHSLATPGAFLDHCRALGVTLPFHADLLAGPESPLAQPITVCGVRVSNRFAVQPMEGWDGTTDGLPTERTLRRWRRFGESGAQLIWGGEAVAVRPDARANPNQLMLHEAKHEDGIAQLREALLDARHERYGSTEDLCLGLQLTHSGRFCRPTDPKRLDPAILYRHPLLDRKFGLPDDTPLLTDGDIRAIVDDTIQAATRAHRLGFQFVDLKHCHGYLGHEFLSAKTREGDYGGSLENRTRYLRELTQGIRAAAPGLQIGVRVSAFDLVPFRPDPETSRPGALGPGVPEDFSGCLPYRYAFGAEEANPLEVDLTEVFAFFEMLRSLGITLVNVTAGSPYYNPHIQRPALYPPSDGYAPPEDPLVGVARQMAVTHRLKERFPDMTLVGTGYTYLQEYLPHVAQAAVADGWTDFVGLGRMILSYPWLPADLLAGERARHKLLCRTFSDCTTAPRNGLPSGCYPLDDYYKKSDEAEALFQAKRAAVEGVRPRRLRCIQ